MKNTFQLTCKCCISGFGFFKKRSARIILSVVLYTLLYGIQSLYAVSTETVEALIDETRVLSEPIELHLTSEVAPLVNSTVSLNHVDAWLFFDNIKPSVVVDSFGSKIQISGSPLNIGINARVAIYAHGAVVMPHGASFKPLTVYNEEGFSGDSMQMYIHTYYNNLGNMNNAIKSFRLKRGYMATLASNSDGTGYSRVFIADKEDLVVSTMPGLLDATVSFIRVFKHQWVTKKGKAGWNPNDINATCYYDWNIGGGSSLDFEYAAIRQNAGWPSWTAINAKEDISQLLGFNEPDRPDQANMTFQQMIDIWPSMMNSGLRIGSPAYSNPWSDIGGNLFDFINTCDELNYRVDFVALHCYWGGKSPINWYNDLKYIHEQTGRPLWITEWNNGANWTSEWWPDQYYIEDTNDKGELVQVIVRPLTDASAQKQLNDISGILTVFDTASFIERYFIYDWVEDCRAMVFADTLTPAGKYYAANKSEFAYNSINEVTPGWNFKEPELSVRYLSFSDLIRVEWLDPNGVFSKEYILERKINNGSYDTIYTSNDISKLYYIDDFDSTISGNVIYRLSLLTKENNFLYSNEISYFQTASTGSSDSIQAVKFKLDNSEWTTALFAKKYTDEPLVVLGMTEFNNTIPLTQRVGNINTSSFGVLLDPWDYLNDPKLTKTDVVSALSIPPGRYDFGGLQAEANLIPEVARDCVLVTFDQPFSVKPSVFCSILTSKTSFPLIAAIRNVTETGFEVYLKSEEAVSRTIFPEKVSFLAIEPGQGNIGNKRITVGQSTDENLISTLAIEIEYDSTYSDPIFFGGLLTTSNDFASTIRYYSAGENKIKIIKQRESSGGTSSSQEEQFGWMVMDLAEGQTIDTIDTTTTSKELRLEPLDFYPNPATDLVYFNFNQQTNVQIIDITGHIIRNEKILHAMDISSLSYGLYMLKIDGRAPAILIKQ